MVPSLIVKAECNDHYEYEADFSADQKKGSVPIGVGLKNDEGLQLRHSRMSSVIKTLLRNRMERH